GSSRTAASGSRHVRLRGVVQVQLVPGGRRSRMATDQDHLARTGKPLHVAGRRSKPACDRRFVGEIYPTLAGARQVTDAMGGTACGAQAQVGGGLDRDVCSRWRLTPGRLLGDRATGTWEAMRDGAAFVVKHFRLPVF